jgi:GNAT superfamily N-acetyltransferase
VIDIARSLGATRGARPFAVRRPTPVDATALAAMLARLSPRSRYLRFGTERPLQGEAALREAARMLSQASLIATAQGDHGEEVIGVAELAADGAGCELAVVVRDDRQTEGVGSALVRRLVAQASARSIAMVRCYILPENRAMLQLVRKLDVRKQSRFHQGMVEYTLSLTG